MFFSGAVFQDGQEKTTKLPSLTRGSVVTFDTEVLQSGKVRVTVEVNDKIVTFDWTVEKASSVPTPAAAVVYGFGTSAPEQGQSIALYFAIRFSGLDWRIGVE